jgi:hypothetical protein
MLNNVFLISTFVVFLIGATAFAQPSNVANSTNHGFDTMYNLASLFIPQQSVILWGGVWVFSIITRNSYLLYIATTFMWVDWAFSAAAGTICSNMSTCATTGYCGEGQMISSFYATLVAHHFFFGPFPPHIITIIACFIGALVPLIAMIVYQLCTFTGILVSIVVGCTLGMLRVVFYADNVAQTILLDDATTK